jgi:hypothetical protein
MANNMNIAGVTQTAQVLPTPQPQAEAPRAADEAASGADSVNLSAQVSAQVLDMAQSQFEDAANQLISTMAAATGVGQNVDVSA